MMMMVMMVMMMMMCQINSMMGTDETVVKVLGEDGDSYEIIGDAAE